MGDPGRREAAEQRRRVLRLLGAAAGGAALGAVVQGAGCAAPRQGPLRVPVAEIDRSGRVVLRFRDQPVELRRDGDGFVARSLICTHMSCVVRWEAGEGVYLCPCHDGRYDAEGRVIGGPPPAPLTRIPLRLDGDAVVVGG